MRIYNQVRSVPADALSPIAGGPLKGKSNIAPQWRFQRLTELFGVCGEGWKVEQVSTVHIDDEAYKKAYTDAVSVACKALGFAADVYYRQDETKYGTFRAEPPGRPTGRPR
ncbi:MAG: hypothetical protein K6E61_06005 [Bacteroidales bacterium]|nr:hypothetical protein [Bacteroidales bacterium]